MPILRQYFAWQSKLMQDFNELYQLWMADSRRVGDDRYHWGHCVDVCPWTIHGPLVKFRANEAVPQKIELIGPTANSPNKLWPLPPWLNQVPLHAPMHYFCSGIRVSFDGELSAHHRRWWMERTCHLWIGCKSYYSVVLAGMNDTNDGVLPEVDLDAVPVIPHGMDYRLELEGIACDCPRDFSVIGFLHGFLARGVQ